MSISFNITDSLPSTTRARTGIIQTPHGKIETPIFMPVGTQGKENEDGVPFLGLRCETLIFSVVAILTTQTRYA